MSETQRKLAMLKKHELPSHWKPPSGDGPLGLIKTLVFRVLCICAYGQPRLDFMWASIKLAEEGDEDVWIDGRKRTSEQQNNILVLAGLLLATSSVFITTLPPNPTFLDWTRRGPYLCICGAFVKYHQLMRQSHVHHSLLLDAGPLQRPTLPTEKSARSDFSELSDRDKKRSILQKYPLPEHWRAPEPRGILGRLHRIIFSTLCLCAYGRTEMDFVWAAIKLAEDGDETVWLDGRKRTSEQQNNILVLAGLLLATSSVFITTPPPRPDLLDYTRWGPYFCICGAFGVLIGVISVASVMILVTTNLSPTHAKDLVLMLSTSTRVAVIAYPPVWTGAATLLLAFGIQSGVWSASNLAFKLGAAVTLIQPLFVAFLYLISSMPIRRTIREEPRSMISPSKEDDA
ncbi:hypothetical protein D9619_002311 [Psilocybe cf. subviscida]|uniref:Uncharacterized protein n=1 Tax=Psilocybe cf. subviscida TaxID=2480587 RepID=A0A8H5AXE6_9AGAR|nr:hypothetical protein D9619_002311 [Psilocybe cf. subviscida]